MWLASLLAMNRSAKVSPLASATFTPAVYIPAVVIPGNANSWTADDSPACVPPAVS